MINETGVLERRNDEPLTTADIARRDPAPSPPDASAAMPDLQKRDALFVASECDQFRGRWHDIQGSFVDEPKDAVQKADELVAAVIKRLAEVFADERAKLEHDWSEGQDISTEDLRLALRRYRSFFDRLLSV
jgi:hypothetical protein